MTSYIFGPGDSLTSWCSGRILAKGARGPGFNPRWKLGVKFPTWNIWFLLFLRSIGVQYDPQKILFRFIKLQTLPPSKKRGVHAIPFKWYCRRSFINFWYIILAHYEFISKINNLGLFKSFDPFLVEKFSNLTLLDMCTKLLLLKVAMWRRI